MAWDWVNPESQRWYHARLLRSLWGDLILETRWGGHLRNGVGVRHYPVANRKEAAKILRRLRHRRIRHQYVQA
jgi:hypothetical protein